MWSHPRTNEECLPSSVNYNHTSIKLFFGYRTSDDADDGALFAAAAAPAASVAVAATSTGSHRWGYPCGNFTSPAVSDRATPTPPGSALSDEELTYVDHSRTPTYSGVKNGLQTAIAGGKAERTVNSTKQEGLIRTCTGSTTSTIIVAS